MKKKRNTAIIIIILLIIILSLLFFKGTKCGDGIRINDRCQYIKDCPECASETDCSQYINCNDVCASKGLNVENEKYCGPDIDYLLSSVKAGKTDEILKDYPQCYCCCK